LKSKSEETENTRSPEKDDERQEVVTQSGEAVSSEEGNDDSKSEHQCEDGQENFGGLQSPIKLSVED